MCDNKLINIAEYISDSTGINPDVSHNIIYKYTNPMEENYTTRICSPSCKISDKCCSWRLIVCLLLILFISLLSYFLNRNLQYKSSLDEVFPCIATDVIQNAPTYGNPSS